MHASRVVPTPYRPAAPPLLVKSSTFLSIIIQNEIKELLICGNQM